MGLFYIVASIVLLWYMIPVIDHALGRIEVFANSARKTRAMRAGILFVISIVGAEGPFHGDLLNDCIGTVFLIGAIVSLVLIRFGGDLKKLEDINWHVSPF